MLERCRPPRFWTLAADCSGAAEAGKSADTTISVAMRRARNIGHLDSRACLGWMCPAQRRAGYSMELARDREVPRIVWNALKYLPWSEGASSTLVAARETCHNGLDFAKILPEVDRLLS
jgi:hypothetical protein